MKVHTPKKFYLSYLSVLGLAAVMLAAALLFTGPTTAAPATPNAVISGTIINPDGTSISNATTVCLRLVNDDNSWGDVIQCLDTDAAGGFAFDLSLAECIPGRFMVQGNPPDGSPYYPTIPTYFMLYHDAQTVNLGSLRLTYATFTGTVYEPDGVTPAGDGTIIVEGQQHNNDNFYIVAVAEYHNGNYSIGGLPSEELWLEASPPDGTIFASGSAGPFMVEMDSQYDPDATQHHDIVLSSPNFSGTVFYPGGDPVEWVMDTGGSELVGWAEVQAWNDRSDTWEGGPRMTTPSGEYGLGLEDADHYLIARPRGTLATTYTRSIPFYVAQDEIPGTAPLTLTYPAVAGYIVGPSGDLITESVSVWLADDAGDRVADMDSVNGWYALGGLFDGSYSLHTDGVEELNLFPAQERWVDVDEESQYLITGTQFITLQLTTPQLAVWVLDPNGEIITGNVHLGSDDEDVGMSERAGSEPAYFGGFHTGTVLYLEALPMPGDIPTLANSSIVSVTVEADLLPITLTLNYPNVVGRVVAPDGYPLPAGDEPVAWMNAENMCDCGVDIAAYTNDDGDFGLWLPLGMDYSLTAEPSDLLAYTYTHSLAHPITLTGTTVPSLTEVGDIRLTYPRVKGMVMGPHGGFEGCAYVWLEDEYGDVADIDKYCTADDWMYMLGGVEAGDYWLVAQDVAGEYYPSSPIFVHVEPDSQYDPDSTQVINIHLMDEAGISGYVVDCHSGDRIPGAFVVAHDDEWMHVRWDQTDDEGEFHISGVISGMTYLVEAYPPYDGDYVQSAPVAVVPVTRGVRLEMCQAVTNVVGIVHDQQGNPVPDSWAAIWNDDYWEEAIADEEGQFAFRNMPTGDFTLQVGPPWDSQGWLAAPAISVTVPTSSSLVDVGVITLPLALKQVTGHVYYAGTTNGVSNAEVYADRIDAPGFAVTQVEMDGSFVLSLSEGEWYLSAEPMDAEPIGDKSSENSDWFFPGPPVHITFQEPATVTEVISNVVLEVVTADSVIEGQILCPGEAGPISCAEIIAPDDIWVEADDGMYNGVTPDENYHFSIPVHAGWYEVSVYVGHPNLQGPEDIPVSVGHGETYDLGDLVLFSDNAMITGHVYNGMGDGVEGVPVAAWRADDRDWDWTETDASGAYTLYVTGGQWFVEPEPDPDMPYVFSGGPRLVDVAEGGTVAGIDFTLRLADARIKGIAVDENTGQRICDLYGQAWAELAATGDFFSDAEVWNGMFILKASGGYTYNVGIDVPPYEGYVSGWRGPVAVEPGQVTTVTIPLPSKDARITGALVDGATGAPVEDAPGAIIFGDDEYGHWAEAFVGDDGHYEMDVISGTWYLRAWVPPESGYVAAPDPVTVTVQAGEVISQDFEIWPVGGVITGVVLAPDGGPLTTTAFVYAEGESPIVGYFETYTETDESGNFALYVPTGGYIVGAGLPEYELDARGWMNPQPVDVPWVAPDSPATGLELRFRQMDGLISGTITFSPTVNVTVTHPAYVWGWTDDGAWTEADAPVVSGTNIFTYAMPVISDTVWHIGALYEDWDGGWYYESAEVTVPVGYPDCNVRQDLVLMPGDVLLDPFVISFDGSQMQTIEMPDGVELIIPPGALVVSGTVTIYILPTNELPDLGAGRAFIGTGYEIWAVDQDGREITQFNKPVTVIFPYPPDAVLEAAGVDEAQLVPVYYSTLVGDWVLADSYVLDTVHNEVTLHLSHFSKWGVMSPEAAGGTTPLPNKVYLPLVLRNQ